MSWKWRIARNPSWRTTLYYAGREAMRRRWRTQRRTAPAAAAPLAPVGYLLLLLLLDPPATALRTVLPLWPVAGVSAVLALAMLLVAGGSVAAQIVCLVAGQVAIVSLLGAAGWPLQVLLLVPLAFAQWGVVEGARETMQAIRRAYAAREASPVASTTAIRGENAQACAETEAARRAAFAQEAERSQAYDLAFAAAKAEYERRRALGTIEPLSATEKAVRWQRERDDATAEGREPRPEVLFGLSTPE